MLTFLELMMEYLCILYIVYLVREVFRGI